MENQWFHFDETIYQMCLSAQRSEELTEIQLFQELTKGNSCYSSNSKTQIIYDIFILGIFHCIAADHPYSVAEVLLQCISKEFDYIWKKPITDDFESAAGLIMKASKLLISLIKPLKSSD